MTENLLPCPFCGSKDLSITLSVTCNGCGARAAKVFWNTRLAAQADAPAIQPQQMRDCPEAEYVKAICKHLRSSHPYSGITDKNDVAAADLIEVLYLAALPALTRPECGEEQ